MITAQAGLDVPLRAVVRSSATSDTGGVRHLTLLGRQNAGQKAARLVCLGSSVDIRSFPDQAPSGVHSRSYEDPCPEHGLIKHPQ
jgi:hypothetical protein